MNSVRRNDAGGGNGHTRQEIRSLLAEKVRVLTATQVASTWFQHTKHPLRSAMSCLRALAARGDVRLGTAMLHPELPVTSPLLNWVPGEDEPDFGRLAWRAKSRFTDPPRRTGLVFPGPRLRIGGQLRPLRATETQHDVMVAAILLGLAKVDRAVIERWHHEDVLRERFGPGEKRPDAILVEDEGEVYIECAGSYSKAKLLEVHRAFGHLPYRLY